MTAIATHCRRQSECQHWLKPLSVLVSKLLNIYILSAPARYWLDADIDSVANCRRHPALQLTGSCPRSRMTERSLRLFARVRDVATLAGCCGLLCRFGASAV